MSIERKDTVKDPLVADTYKALANERAPDHLNDKVLRMAAREGRTRFAAARAWTRPLAWAATIGLSLAIVLELTRLPQIEPDAVPVMAPAESTPASTAIERSDGTTTDAFAPRDMAVLREAENRARAQAGPNAQPTMPQAEVDKTPAASVPTQPVATENALVDTASADVAAAPVAAFSTAADERKRAPESACPAKSRESAASWMVCISELREDGRDDLADSEYAELQRIFPNFADSEAHK